MKKQLLIIKFGGSVVTYKELAKPKVRINIIKSLAKQLSIINKRGLYQFILVHGAGSYAHPIVKRNDLHNGMKTTQQKLAFTETLQSMLKLNYIITQAFFKKRIPVMAFPPHSFVTQSNKRLNNFNSKIIESALNNNQIPILYGDLVFDDILGCSVLSGDVIVSNLARKLSIDKIIFLSDVEGIFDRDPKKYPNATLIPQINNDNLKEILHGISKNNPDDVTGEMRGKILAIKENIKNIEVLVANGFKENILVDLLSGKLAGTKLIF